MHKLIFYIVLSVSIYSGVNTKNIVNNTIQSDSTEVIIEETQKTAEDYYRDAEAHEKEAKRLYKRGALIFIISLGLYFIGSIARKKSNKKKNN